MVIKRHSALQLGLVAAAVAVAVGAQLRVHEYPDALGGWALLFGAAAVASVAARNLSLNAETGPTLSGRLAPPGRSLAWGIVTLCTVVATTILSRRSERPVLGLVLWASGFATGALALRGWVVSPPRRVAPRWTRWEIAAFLATIALGAAARVIWPGSIPRFYFADEARLAWSLVQTYRVSVPNFFTMGWNGWPWIAISLQGMFGPLLGVTTSSLRLSSALMGTLAIGATYLLARELFNPRMAVLAALLFALCRTAIDFSRLGVCHAQLMFYETFAFFWWWRAVNTGRAASYWWAGVGFGLCLLTYNAGDLVPPLWLGWLVLSLVFVPRTGREYWRATVITAAGLLAVAYPWLDHITDHLTFGATWAHWTIIARGRQTVGLALDAWGTNGLGAAAAILSRQAWLTWLGFGVLPSGGYRELGYRGGGMLDDVTAALFVIGLAMSLPWRRRVREGFVLYWWVATAIVGGVMTIDAPAPVRLVGVLPALALLAAIPLDKLLSAGAGARARSTAAAALVAMLLAGAAWANWQTYFVAFANAPYADDQSAAGRRIEQLPSGSTVFLLGSHEFLTFFNELFHFNYPGRRLEDVADPAHLLPLHQPVTFPLAVILGPSQVTLASYARALYPHTEIIDDIFTPERRLRFRELRLTPEDVAAQNGLQLTVYDSSNAMITQRTGDPFASKVAVPTSAARLEWRGRIYWPTDRPVTLAVQVKQPTEVHLADAPVVQVTPPAANVALTLPRGWQPLSITEPASGERALSMVVRYAGVTRPVTAWDLNPDPVEEGLTAVYERDGQPLLRVIDPQLNAFAFTEEPVFIGANAPMVRVPFSATWSGALRITTPGTYRFEAQGTGTYSVRLDDTDLVEATHGSVRGYGDRGVFAERGLAAGLHPIEARWTCNKPAQGLRRVFQLYWTPPGGERELIPPPSFVPGAQSSP
jgi:hypothetical protein